MARLAALIWAGLVGLALQRGRTWTVAAVDALMATGPGTRLLVLGEASLWVASGLLVVRAVVHGTCVRLCVRCGRQTGRR